MWVRNFRTSVKLFARQGARQGSRGTGDIRRGHVGVLMGSVCMGSVRRGAVGAWLGGSDDGWLVRVALPAVSSAILGFPSCSDADAETEAEANDSLSLSSVGCV